MNKNNQQGFTVVGIVVTVIALAVVAFAAWRVYDANNQPKEVTTTTDTSNSDESAQNDPNAGYLVIKEWGVRLPLAGEVQDAIYKSHSTNDGSPYANLSTTSIVAKLGEDCGVDSNYPALGYIARQPNTEAAAPGYKAEKQVGDYTYFYYTPQTTCSNDSSMDDTLSANLALMRSSFDNIEAAK
jgi:hypothetical protein